ncbi:MAG: ComEC/Rec2 family competence protein [bacterium]
MIKLNIFVGFCLAFIIGIFFGPLLKVSLLLFPVAFLCLIFIVLKRKLFLLISLCFFLGLWRYEAAINQRNQSVLMANNDSSEIITIEGVVSEEPTKAATHLKIVVKGETFYINGEKKTGNSGKALVIAPRYPEYGYGDRLRVEGKLETPQASEDFDYQQYLAKDGIYSTVYFPKLSLIGRGGNSVYRGVFSLKRSIENSLNRLMAPPQSAIMEALLFGNEENLSWEWKEKLNATGTRHIAAVSGMNITIITLILFNFLLFLGFWRSQAFYCSIIFIWLYILMVGMPASGIRAGIMACIFLAARHFGRLSSAPRAIILSADLMLCQNPFLLRWDVGFQLSFLATLGLVYLQPFLGKLFAKIPNFFEVRTTLAATVAAQVFTLPILVYNFGRIPVLSPFINILIVPFLPFVTIYGFIFSLLGIFWQLAAQILSWPVWFLLTGLLEIVNQAAKVSFVSLAVGNVYWPWLFVYYLLLGTFIWRLMKRRQEYFLG